MRKSLVLVTLAAVAAAGCTTTAATDLSTQLRWQDPSHAVLTVRNDGSTPVDMSQMMQTMVMTGPNGSIPMYWGGANGSMPACWLGPESTMQHGHMGRGHCAGQDWDRMPMATQGSQLMPGETWTYHMHAVAGQGTWGMMMEIAPANGSMMPMHAYGDHMTLADGDYTCAFADQTARARLAG